MRMPRPPYLPIALLLGACTAPLHLNDIQVVGTHNSYKRRMDPVIFTQLAARDPRLARTLDYGHPPLQRQLDLGARQLELDVYYDPRGGRFARPRVLEELRASGRVPSEPFDSRGELLEPGFKVLHRADVDFGSQCPTLQRCLRALRDWSRAHPRHVPILITVNAKDALATRPGEIGLDAEAWDALDRELIEGVGRGRLLTPDDVRGEHETLADAVVADDWPELDGVRGKLLFVLDEDARKIASYAAGHPSLRGRVLFVDAVEGRAESAVRIVNDPVEQRDYIRRLVEQGYLVRTRADASTEQARTGDTRRRDAALASGAHAVSSDYLQPDPRFGTGYAVQLPGGAAARCNPVRRPSCRIGE